MIDYIERMVATATTYFIAQTGACELPKVPVIPVPVSHYDGSISVPLNDPAAPPAETAFVHLEGIVDEKDSLSYVPLERRNMDSARGSTGKDRTVNLRSHSPGFHRQINMGRFAKEKGPRC